MTLTITVAAKRLWWRARDLPTPRIPQGSEATWGPMTRGGGAGGRGGRAPGAADSPGRGKTVSGPGSGSFPELAINGAHTALTWSSVDGQHVLRLTGPDESFTMPRSNCKLSLSPDGTATAICRVEGEAVPGCFEPARG